MRLQTVDTLPVKSDFAFIGPYDTGDGVEQRGLPGAVGPDNAGDAAAGNSETAAIDSPVAAKRLDQTADIEFGRHHSSTL